MQYQAVALVKIYWPWLLNGLGVFLPALKWYSNLSMFPCLKTISDTLKRSLLTLLDLLSRLQYGVEEAHPEKNITR